MKTAKAENVKTFYALVEAGGHCDASCLWRIEKVTVDFEEAIKWKEERDAWRKKEIEKELRERDEKSIEMVICPYCKEYIGGIPKFRIIRFTIKDVLRTAEELGYINDADPLKIEKLLIRELKRNKNPYEIKPKWLKYALVDTIEWLTNR